MQSPRNTFLRYVTHICWLLFFFYAQTGYCQQTGSIITDNASRTHGNTYAVVIGISKYQNTGIPQLQYADRDAKVFADYLRSKPGGSVPESHIRLLLNEQAGMAAIYDAMDWLRDSALRGDVVYFYFSGHGDVENATIYKLGFLLSYNTPRNNYLNNAVRIEDLNDIANTLSTQSGAKVILVTDACHSGKLAGSDFRGAFLVGDQLRTIQGNEIRMTSCGPDQLSAEDEGWGGGRGAFSYYLVNGLQGMADLNHDSIITVQEIKQFLDSSLSNDLLLAQKKVQQQPEILGKDNFALSKVDRNTLLAMKLSPAPITTMGAPMNLGAMAPLAKPPQAYLLDAIQEGKPELLYDFHALNQLPTGQLPLAFLDSMPYSLRGKVTPALLHQLKASLMENPDALQRFSNKMAIILSDRGQEAINLYLEGDVAELEKRRYYNKSDGYDGYPDMFSVAMKLISPGNYMHHLLEIKMHYFAGVAARLKMPVSPHADSLLKVSLMEQTAALQLEQNAAYIQNEMGILLFTKKDLAGAEKYFTRAGQLAPTWAIPHANLASLYAEMNLTREGFVQSSLADSLQPGLQLTAMSNGLLYEKTGNWLLAEEAYRKSIEINSRHCLPFERLGSIYLHTTEFAQSDSFYYEADKRKKGYQFNGNNWFMRPIVLSLAEVPKVFCALDTLHFIKDDLIAFFAWGIQNYEHKDYSGALRIFKKVVALDPKNPLVFHYLGKIYFDNHQWENAEAMFGLSRRYYMDQASLQKYKDSLVKGRTYPYAHDCLEATFLASSFGRTEDLFFMGTLYQSWGHDDEAVSSFSSAIQQNPREVAGYCKLWALLESLGRYQEAEQVIISYGHQPGGSELSQQELNAFYRRAVAHFPQDSYWPYQLGLLLYNRSEAPSFTKYLDSVVYFPLLDREKMVDTFTYHHLITDSSLLISDKNESGAPLFIELVSLPTGLSHPVTVPGTWELFPLAGRILTPRSDGLQFLKQAADLIGDTAVVADLYARIGQIYLWAGSRRMALPYLKLSVNWIPGNASIRMKLIESARALYNNKLALENLEYLYDHRQISFPDHVNLAHFYMLSSQFTRSAQLLDEVASVYPFQLDLTKEFSARLHLLSGQYRESLDMYRQLLVRRPTDPATLYNLARINAHFGNRSEAFRLLELSMKNGFRYSYVLSLDPMMQSIRGTTQWDLLLKQYPAKQYNRPGPFVKQDYLPKTIL